VNLKPMRRAAKVDENQPEIVAAARRMGCTVQPLHSIGQGCPDLLVGISGINDLWEVKDGKKVPSARQLTTDQLIWHDEWRGNVQVIDSVEKAIARINYVRSCQHQARANQ
jgi:hypothetical protein